MATITMCTWSSMAGRMAAFGERLLSGKQTLILSSPISFQGDILTLIGLSLLM
jgi:hypothetical protein